MRLVRITPKNLKAEHLCCAISNRNGYHELPKKLWMKDLLDEGLVFLRGNDRGKCFIEYVPAEYAWSSIEAEGYMFINCFKVSAQYRGLGFGEQLLDACIKDAKAKGRKGLAVISTRKKRGCLADYKFLWNQGFRISDTAPPYFVLMYLPFDEDDYDKDERIPSFHIHERGVREDAKTSKGFLLYYTHQCPLTAKYVPLLEAIAKRRNIDFHAVHLTSRQQAKEAGVPFPTFSLYYRGVFITHEILSERKFEKLIE